ncbi:EamA family transporter [Halopseudomonas aestusnigri]|uniref:O-acetylserine/cysteine efflux transporter n=1 Tax=Halopseudomonas aestusnigri TaxID=857252 RepID=A0AAQ1G5G4_9GAMM|nr:EamA family transporter [Halopseudomonas aestusnigri]OWL90248.1 O-acetylserine/cysteine exporter [Halopseudomonas aestusnigri]SEF88401.1 O-acetylserine/cysteine efflux transporter [Halopseudomonas aestusnigri]
MPLSDLLRALAVILLWGLNFVVIKLGLDSLPPMLLGAMRFTLAAIPAVFFIPRPRIPLRWLIAYGMTISFGQFAFLFSAMTSGMPAGMASLVLQSQAFFTLMLAAALLGEKARTHNLAGLLVAATGLLLIGLESGSSMTTLGLILTLCAALMWACGNIITKQVGQVNLTSLVVWGSLIPPVPFMAMSFWLEGPQQIHQALSGVSGTAIFALFYLAFGATLIGYGLWSRLLSRYPAGRVAPFSMLVPVVGLSSSSLILGEKLNEMQILGALLIMLGLAVNVFGGALRRRGRRLQQG